MPKVTYTKPHSVKGFWFDDLPIGTMFHIVNENPDGDNWCRLLKSVANRTVLRNTNISPYYLGRGLYINELRIPRDCLTIVNGHLTNDSSRKTTNLEPLKSVEKRKKTTLHPLTPNTEASTESQHKIIDVCDSIKDVLLEKNKRYGDSALKPKKIFSKLDGDEGIKIRLDDKIGRIMNSGELRKNDVADLIGYLTLYSVSQGWNFKDQID